MLKSQVWVKRGFWTKFHSSQWFWHRIEANQRLQSSWMMQWGGFATDLVLNGEEMTDFWLNESCRAERTVLTENFRTLDHFWTKPEQTTGSIHLGWINEEDLQEVWAEMMENSCWTTTLKVMGAIGPLPKYFFVHLLSKCYPNER